MSQPALSLINVNPQDLPDVQAEAPEFALVLDEAGIADLRYPITIHLADGSAQPTVALTSFAVSVAADTRGVHMSRFVEILHEWHKRISVESLTPLLTDIRDRLAARDVAVRLEFPLFLERVSPMSGGRALVCYDCTLEGRMERSTRYCTVTVRVPITSLCPCSREISDYGAHNQRGSIEIMSMFDLSHASELLDFTDLIVIAEGAGSAPIYSLLKRVDERFVTMQAYENPAFVEDITRAVATSLKAEDRIRAGHVRVVNEESIHAHNAYAAIRWSR